MRFLLGSVLVSALVGSVTSFGGPSPLPCLRKAPGPASRPNSARAAPLFAAREDTNVLRDLHQEGEWALSRPDFLSLAKCTGVGALAVGASGSCLAAEEAGTRQNLVPPARPAQKKQTTSYIDVDVDLGDGFVLSIRQPFGEKQAAAQDDGSGGDRQGTYIWPAGTDLAKFLLSDVGRAVLSGKNVIELGAGTAIAGLAASVAGAASTTLTDGMPEVLDVTRDTVKRNAASLACGQLSRPSTPIRETLVSMPAAGGTLAARDLGFASEPTPLSVGRLRWGNAGDLSVLLGRRAAPGARGGFDVVVGAEITYLSASLDPLLGTISSLLASSELPRPAAAPGRPAVLGDVPVALLTYTPHLTAFDGGGVAELERKARANGLRVTHFRSDEDETDTRLLALTLMR